jgi:SAM-dependent methyltransferase
MAEPPIICPEDGLAVVAENGQLTCARGHHWSRHAGIARMLPFTDTYADAFGLQWKVFRRTQLDSYTHTTLSRDRARHALGEDAWALLHRQPAVDVLEVGCGAGRFTEVLLASGARVTSVDLSSAVEANQENFPQSERHRIVQADVRRLPFAPQQFDLVFCLGTIQHTPDSEETIARLYDQVRPGGWLVIDHYAYTLSAFTKTAPLFRMVLRRVSPERGLAWSGKLVRLFFPLHRAARKSRIAQALLSRVSPVYAYFHTYPLSDELQREWALLDTHDALTDWYKRYRTRGQIRHTLERLGLTDILCERAGNGVEARGRRPL